MLITGPDFSRGEIINSQTLTTHDEHVNYYYVLFCIHMVNKWYAPGVWKLHATQVLRSKCLLKPQ